MEEDSGQKVILHTQANDKRSSGTNSCKSSRTPFARAQEEQSGDSEDEYVSEDTEEEAESSPQLPGRANAGDTCYLPPLNKEVRGRADLLPPASPPHSSGLKATPSSRQRSVAQVQGTEDGESGTDVSFEAGMERMSSKEADVRRSVGQGLGNSQRHRLSSSSNKMSSSGYGAASGHVSVGRGDGEREQEGLDKLTTKALHPPNPPWFHLPRLSQSPPKETYGSAIKIMS